MASRGEAPARKAGGAAAGRPLLRALGRMQLTGSTRAPAAAGLAGDAQWRRSGAPGALQTVADLPAALVAALEAEEARASERLPGFHGRRRGVVALVRDAYEVLDSAAQDKKPLRRILHELVQRLLDPNGVHSAADDQAAADPDATPAAVARERDRFLQVGGAECLLRVIHALRMEAAGQSKHAAATAGVTLVLDGERRQRQRMAHRNDMCALWQTPLPGFANPTKAAGSDATAKKGILNDAMVSAFAMPYCLESPR